MRFRTCALAGCVALGFLAGSPSSTATPEPTVATDRQAGLRSLSFPVSEGRIQIFLPADAAAGDVLSGTVRAIAQDERDLAVLQGRVLEIDDQPMEVSQRRFRWQVPPGGQAVFVLRGREGQEEGRLRVGFRPCPWTPQEEDPSRGFQFPKTARAGQPISIFGRFDGLLDTTRLLTEERELDLLAESPRQLVAWLPEGTSRAQRLRLREADAEASSVLFVFPSDERLPDRPHRPGPLNPSDEGPPTPPGQPPVTPVRGS